MRGGGRRMLTQTQGLSSEQITGSDGRQKALGGHPIFMRCSGSKANIPFQEQATGEEFKVRNNFQGHTRCI